MVTIGSFKFFISIHAAREGGDEAYKTAGLSANISIHAAREGGDIGNLLTAFSPFLFQSTPPVKAATYVTKCRALSEVFQSTPPVKAATYATFDDCTANSISIHAAREGGDLVNVMVFTEGTISIHAAREGGDEQCWIDHIDGNHFNPRRP